ncbi:MAG TPA: PASTA domain-containing protein [Vicinamibacteria bacterium]
MSVRRFAILLVKYGLLAVALLVTTGLSALFTMRVVLTAQDVEVPSFLGRRLPEAGALAAGHGLLVKVEGRRNDPRVPPDRVMAQEPAAGSTLKRQRSVRVWVSLGPQRLNVPAVEGESVRTGRLSLEQAQVPVGRVVEVHDAAEEGTILQQHPPPGETSALEPHGASLLVSTGSTSGDFVMPDMINRPADAVLDILARAGLKVTDVRHRSYPGVAPGVVLRQSPPAGYRVNRHTSVSLEVSRE